MTTACCYRTFVLLTALSYPLSVKAEPPGSLVGKFVSLAGDRIELLTADAGTNGLEAVEYFYNATDSSTAEMTVTYPSSGRSREVTLTFHPDGTPAAFQEFDFSGALPPMPPILRTGSFEIGALDEEPDPEIESSAPDALTGAFIRAGHRFEFLTADKGRRYQEPNRASYADYIYEIVDATSARAVLAFENGVRETTLLLTFDADGGPVSYARTDRENGEIVGESAGELEMGDNHNVTDLKIGWSESLLAGDDVYNKLGQFQTLHSKRKTRDPFTVAVVVENDGEPDTITLRGSNGRRDFHVEYFSRPGGENITAEMISGQFSTGELAHRGESAIAMQVTPRRDQAQILAGVSATSDSVERASDRVSSIVHVNSKKKKSRQTKGRRKGR